MRGVVCGRIDILRVLPLGAREVAAEVRMARLAFFGTPDLAAIQRDALTHPAVRARGHEVVLVVAQPDRKKGRGQHLEAPPVKERALALGVPVAQPSTLRKDTEDGDAFFAQLTALKLDLAIVAAYGRILPQRVLDVPARGMVNVHASLLPRWRGAAPIQRAIEAGDAQTGVCLMHMVKELDAGAVYAKSVVPISDTDDTATLTDRLAHAGAALLTAHLDALLLGTLFAVPQPAEGLTYAHQLEKEHGRLDFTKDAHAVACQARAMHPWPGASTLLGVDVLKLFAPRALAPGEAGRGAPGEVLRADHALVVACGAGAVAFAEAQLPNKKRMPVAELVKGRAIPAGTRLGAA